jgi:hypothetical protein
MINSILPIFEKVFKSCASWLDTLITRLDAYWFIISAIAVLLIYSLLIKPLRGGSLRDFIN